MALEIVRMMTARPQRDLSQPKVNHKRPFAWYLSGVSLAGIRFGKQQTLEQKAKRFIRYHDARIRPKREAYKISHWEYYAHGGDTYLKKAEQARIELYQAWRNTRAYNTLTTLLQPENRAQLTEPWVDKALQLFAQTMRPRKETLLSKRELEIDTQKDKLQDYYNQYSKNSGGKTAGAYIPPGETRTYGEMLLDLVRARNAFARLNGYDNYYFYKLAKQNVDEQHLDRLLTEIKSITDNTMPTLTAVLKTMEYGKLKTEWDNTIGPLLKAQSPEDLLKKTAALLGISIESLLSRSDLYMDPARPDKTRHAFCYPINPPYDVRPIMNLSTHPTYRNLNQFKTLLHEVIGHGLDYQHIDPKLPSIFREHEMLATEGQAQLFESLLTNPIWLRQVVNVPEETLTKFDTFLKVSRAERVLKALGWEAVVISVERAMYTNPDQDLDAHYREKAAEHFQMKPEQYQAKSGQWANVIHYASHPVYYQFYLLGHLWELQLEAHLNVHYGGVLSKESTALIQRHRSQGLAETWSDQIQAMTGKPLGTEALVQILESTLQAAQKSISSMPPENSRPQ